MGVEHSSAKLNYVGTLNYAASEAARPILIAVLGIPSESYMIIVQKFSVETSSEVVWGQ